MADVPALSKIQYTASMKKMDLQHQYTVPKAYRYLSGWENHCLSKSASLDHASGCL
jgi:type VI protein secretion system component VasA